MLDISIVVPVYKVENYVRRCIDSLLEQTFKHINVVLVDDGSPDDCGEICDHYAMKDHRVRVIHQPNKGLSAARNVGVDYVLTHLNSDYIGFVDSDDWVSPNYVEELVAGVSLSGTVACTGYARVLNDGKKFVGYRSDNWEVLGTQDYWCHPDPLTVVAWGKLYPRSFFASVRFPVGHIHEDVFTIHKLLFQSPCVAVKFAPLYYYRCREDSIVNKAWTPSRLDEVYALIEQCAYLRENGFEQAYLSVRAKLLGALTGTNCSASLIGSDKAVEFSLILNQTDFYFILIPGETYEIINFITGPGLGNRFTLNSFNIDLIPIDNDLLSMEREGSFNQIYVDNSYLEKMI